MRHEVKNAVNMGQMGEEVLYDTLQKKPPGRFGGYYAVPEMTISL
jgi:hypothetical protein